MLRILQDGWLERVGGQEQIHAERASIKLGIRLVLPSKKNLRLLKLYSWPGNIRELAAVIERAAILGNGKSLEMEKAIGVNIDSALTGTNINNQQKGLSNQQEKIATLDEIMKDYIQYVLNITKGRIEGPHGCALLLGINHNTLRAKMRKLNINRHSNLKNKR